MIKFQKFIHLKIFFSKPPFYQLSKFRCENYFTLKHFKVNLSTSLTLKKIITNSTTLNCIHRKASTHKNDSSPLSSN